VLMSEGMVYECEKAWLDELALDECLALVRANAERSEVGRIAYLVDDGPVVFPVNYCLVETSGRRWIVDRAPMQVAFEVDGVDHLQARGLVGSSARDPASCRRRRRRFPRALRP
jgi:hypothetical protein